MYYYAFRLPDAPASVCICWDYENDADVTLLPSGGFGGYYFDWAAITTDNGAALAAWIASGEGEDFTWKAPEVAPGGDCPTDEQLEEWDRQAAKREQEEEAAYWAAQMAEDHETC